MSKVYLSLALDKRLFNAKDNRYNVKVIVYHNPDGKQLRRRCNTHCYLTVQEFEKLHANGQKSDYVLETRIKIDKYFGEIKSIIDRLGGDFSFEKFDALFQNRGLAVNRGRPSMRPKKGKALIFSENIVLTEVYSYFNDYVKDLSCMGRYGTSISYKSAMIAFYKYKPDLLFSDVTPAFLYGFEEAMLARGLSISTIGIYTRSLRTIINMAIADNLFPQNNYPFGTKRKRKYQIPITRNIKKALSVDNIRCIKTAKVSLCRQPVSLLRFS